MGDLTFLEDLLTAESSISSGDNNDSNAKVSDQTGDGTVNVALDAPGEMTSEGDTNKQNILLPDEVSLPKVKALRIAEKFESDASPKYAKSIHVDSPSRLQPGSSDRLSDFNSTRAVIDTAAPIESVKDAVSKFGGSVDWKTHRIQTLEKRRYMDQELEKTQEEMSEYKKKSQAAEDAKMEVLKELERTKRQIDELELQLNSHSSQSKELTKNKLAPSDECDTAAKSELEAIVAQHETALFELNSIKNELEVEKGKLSSKVSGEASENSEKTLKQLTDELTAAKESLEAAQVAHKDAEDGRNASAMASEQDFLSWEKELKQVEDEVDKLNQECVSAKDMKSKLETASTLLLSLKAELASYMESKMKQEINDARSQREVESCKIKAASARKELENVNLNIQKVVAEVSILKVAASSLQSELDMEKELVAAIKKKGGTAMVALQSLEAELSMIKSEIALAEMSKREIGVKMVDMPSKLRQAAKEAELVKSLTEAAHEELRKAKDEAEQAMAGACTTESRLVAVEKEIEAARASEKLALAAINALQESENVQATGDENSSNVVSISLEEYLALSKRAQEAEEQAKTRLAAASIQIEAAKRSESKSLQKLEEVSRELIAQKGTYNAADKKSEKANKDKLTVEQELSCRRAKNDQRRKAGDAAVPAVTSPMSIPRSIKQRKLAKKSGKVQTAEHLQHKSSLEVGSMDGSSVESDSSPDMKIAKKKKRSLFPRLLIFLGRRKSQSSNKVM